jgi:N-acetylmuramoyl-L-alanine amidase
VGKIMNHKYNLISSAILITFILSFFNNSIAQTSNVNKPKIIKIVIDPGFGGEDPGPAGCGGEIFAKNINLKLSQKLEKKFSEVSGIEAILTRKKDTFVSLIDRITTATRNNADLFISIQANASSDVEVYGVETYYFDFTTDSDRARFGIETSPTQTNATGAQSILLELMLKTKGEDSKVLAYKVQNSLCRYLEGRYKHIKNRGVKRAPFYVLVHTIMPAIIIQTSFITNSRECERLRSEDYQNDIAEGIVKGIQEFMVTKMTK